MRKNLLKREELKYLLHRHVVDHVLVPSDSSVLTSSSDEFGDAVGGEGGGEDNGEQVFCHVPIRLHQLVGKHQLLPQLLGMILEIV